MFQRPDKSGTWPETALFWSALVLAAVLAGLVALVPVVYDTLHVTDTTFMAQAGRWVLDGAVPGVDFEHFYGGMHEWFVAQGLRLSSGHIKALDYAPVLQFGVVAAGLLLAALTARGASGPRDWRGHAERRSLFAF